MREYQIVRTAEGRGSDSDDYYLALPYRDLSGHNQSQWTIRARTFQYFERQILPPLETSQRNRLTILDLGAGNGWMSYRLALRGHKVCAVDLLNNENDGLAAAVHYSQELPELFPRFQAELDCLPFEDSQFDLAVFNASFHYSENYVQTLGEAVRCVRPGGSIVIADTAWYRREESGQQMIAERRNAFTYKYGFPSDAIQSQEYLTDQRLASLAARVWNPLASAFALLRRTLGIAAMDCKVERQARTFALPDLCCRGSKVIILFNPRATRPRNCRLPLSVLALAAMLEGREEYAIVDGNIESDPAAAILRLIDEHKVEMLGVTCMPGPQMAAAMEASREIRRAAPAGSHRVGRLLPIYLSRCGVERQVCRLRRARPGRRHDVGIARCLSKQTRSGFDIGDFL